MKNSYRFYTFKKQVEKMFIFADENNVDLNQCAITFSEDPIRGMSILCFDTVSQRYFGVGVPVAYDLP